MTSLNASTTSPAITDIMNEINVTTTTENDADFGFLAPSSLLTLTLHDIINNSKTLIKWKKFEFQKLVHA